VATQAERRAATTLALRRTALRLFARHGFDAVSVDTIATDAGVTRGAFYHHFDSKEALFEVVLDEVETVLSTAVRQAAVVHTDPLAQLRSGVDRYLDLASDRRYSRIVLVDAPAVLGPVRHREVEEAHFLGLVRASLAGLRPDAPATEIALAARALLAALCTLAMHAAEQRGDLALAKTVAARLLDTVTIQT
jgi:AcrR family transcriptional regulator